MTDTVSHIRANLTSWIAAAPPETIRQLLKIRRNMDSNMRKPSMPAGWHPLKEVAAQLHRNPDHLGRQCQQVYAAQDLARICTVHGRNTWCLAPEAIARLSAAPAQVDEAASTRSTSEVASTPAQASAAAAQSSEGKGRTC